MRILITGSRDWPSLAIIEYAFIHNALAKDVLLVSGSCPTGADAICEAFAASEGWAIERHPADWEKHGKRAGFLRNIEMVSLGADLCLAFIKNESKGATMTERMARKAGIETLTWRIS